MGPSGAPPTTSWASAAADALRNGLTAAADPARAVPMAAYMKDQFVFHGVPARERRQAMREALQGCSAPTEPELFDLVDWLWEQPEREYQYVGTDLLARWQKLIEPDALDHLRRYITTKSWWDTVDALASHVVGGLAACHPSVGVAMDDWIADENLWVARTAILHQLRHKETTDAARLFGYCSRQAEHPDFFIRKAIGWALREYAKTDAAAVADFVAATPELSNLSRREALKHIE